LEYNFPGNVRELKNVIEFMVAISDSEVLDESMLPNYLKERLSRSLYQSKVEGQEAKENFIKIPFNTTLEDAENFIIQKTLERNSYSKKKTAETLHIGLKTVYRKLGSALNDAT